MNAIKELIYGMKAFLVGFKWLKKHPKYLLLLLVPICVAALALIGGYALYYNYSSQVAAYVLYARPDTWYGLSMYYVVYGLLYISILIFILIASILLANIASAPIYEMVSMAVEREHTNKEIKGLSFSASLRVIIVEIKKVFAILCISLILLFIPVVNVLSIAISAFLIGWDVFDYPSARRDWPLKKRLKFVRQNFWAVTGLGLWLVIPVLHIFFLPISIVGGTQLNLRSFEKESLNIT